MTMFCENCGAKISDDSEFCENCGAVVSNDAPEAPYAPPSQQYQQQQYQQPMPPPVYAAPVVEKKKSKLPVIIGVIAGLFILIVIIAALGDDNPEQSPASVGTPGQAEQGGSTPAPASTPAAESAPASAAGAFPQFTRTSTLGNFSFSNPDYPECQRGWASDDSSRTISDFTGARYLVVEFDKVPSDEYFQIVWVGDSADWDWIQTDLDSSAKDRIFFLRDKTLVIDLKEIVRSGDYYKCSELAILLCYYSNSWDDLPIKDAYFAAAG